MVDDNSELVDLRLQVGFRQRGVTDTTSIRTGVRASRGLTHGGVDKSKISSYRAIAVRPRRCLGCSTNFRAAIFNARGLRTMRGTKSHHRYKQKNELNPDRRAHLGRSTSRVSEVV